MSSLLAFAAAITLWCGQVFAPCPDASCAADTWCHAAKVDDEEATVCASECKTDADCPALEGAEVQCMIVEGAYGCFATCEDGPGDCPDDGMACDAADLCVWPSAE